MKKGAPISRIVLTRKMQGKLRMTLSRSKQKTISSEIEFSAVPPKELFDILKMQGFDYEKRFLHLLA